MTDTLQQQFEFLQQQQIALPVCALVVGAVAAVLRKWMTAGVLGVILAVFLIHFYATPLPAFPFVLLGSLAAFAAVGVREAAWPALYVALMPIINWSFSAVPTTAIPDWLGGGQFQPLAIVTGLVLVVRDFAQRQIRHWIFLAMVLGLVLSTLTSWITVVFASGAAFLISETVDWAFYTFSKRPFSERVMLSSLASAPLDQIVFIWLASFVVPGIFAVGTVVTGILSKLIGAWIVSRVIAAQERSNGAKTQMNPA